MTIKEFAIECLNNMSEPELLKFIQEQTGLDDLPTQETIDALAELKYMKKHPEEYKSYSSVEEMFDEILSEDDED